MKKELHLSQNFAQEKTTCPLHCRQRNRREGKNAQWISNKEFWMMKL